MQFLSKAIEFGRQHYEKILLSLALLSLAGAVVWIYGARASEQEKINNYLQGLDRMAKAPMPALNLDSLEAVLQQAQNPPALNLASPHNLLNPVKWLKRSDGMFIKSIKGTEATLDQVQITRIAPLLMTIAFDRYTAAGYMITTTNETVFGQGRRTVLSYQLNDTNKAVLVVREVRGAKEDPSEVVIELKDNNERVALRKDQPFTRTNAFEVDLKYLNNKPFTRQRVNAALNFGGEDYKIVAITPAEVVFSAANDKKYTVRLAGQR